jgi:hypothetical protein
VAKVSLFIDESNIDSTISEVNAGHFAGFLKWNMKVGKPVSVRSS